MCWSNTTLFYGLWVTTASLNFAATAHKATRTTILAIDLIISPRRCGKLEIEGQDEKTSARELPEEVWELVRDQLLGVEVREVELSTISRFRCYECEDRDLDASCRGWRPSTEAEWQQGPPVAWSWNRWAGPITCCSGGCLDNVFCSSILYSRSAEDMKVSASDFLISCR